MDEQIGDHAPGDTLTTMETELRAWRMMHPKATFAELESAVEERIRDLRAHLLEAVTSVPDAGWTRCPDCDTRMAPRGQQMRQLVIPGDQRVELDRAYLVCPSCGTGLFPPRCGAGAHPESLLPLPD